MPETMTVKQLKGVLESVHDDARVVVHDETKNGKTVGLTVDDTKAQFGFFILVSHEEDES